MSTDSDIDQFVELLDSIEGFGPWDAAQDIDEVLEVPPELRWSRLPSRSV